MSGEEFGLSLLVLLSFLTFCLFLVHQWDLRKKERSLRPFWPRGVRSFFRHILIAGTDSDLKLELLYALGLAGVFSVVKITRMPTLASGLLPYLVAPVLGYHARYWVAKWRLQNIVFFGALFGESVPYRPSLSALSALLVNIGVTFIVATAGVWPLVVCFFGFLAHEITLEIAKNRQMLSRKLFLFDLDEPILSHDERRRLISALDRFEIGKIKTLRQKVDSEDKRVALDAFVALLQDDFHKFREIRERAASKIRESGPLLYYFGKASYVIGDLEAARELLSQGVELREGGVCRAYLALALLARTEGREAVEESIDLLRERGERTSGQDQRKSSMFLRAFLALALGIATGRSEEHDEEYLREAIFRIHEAMRINELVRRENELGEMGEFYFRANEQIFLDIYAYLLYRMGNYQLAFRVLEQAIERDNTYPWPYYHLALLYEKVGQEWLAERVFYRIVAHERSESVLKSLALMRLRKI